MAQATIPVDLFNPGQVFACLGLVEVADRILGDARGAFDWSHGHPDRFVIQASGEESPVGAVLRCLGSATVVSLAPSGTDLSTDKWGVPTESLPTAAPFPFPLPDSPATLPARLVCEVCETRVTMDVTYWGDTARHDNAKFWAGSGGYPGAALLRDALNLVRDGLDEAIQDPFSLKRPQSSSFRFDWRRDYIALDAGFSPNEHGNLVMMGFPLVEILAAIGLTDARPRRIGNGKLQYSYGVLGVGDPEVLYDPSFLRAALGGTGLGFPQRRFRMSLGWPGKEGQARCIVNVTEETEG